MKKALLAVAALTCIGSAALAGPNAGGTLILALSEGTVYSPGADYCGSATATDCEGAVTTGESRPSSNPHVVNCLAAFPSPGGVLSGVTFGVYYDDANIAVVASGLCGDFEIADGNWPANGSGTAMSFDTAQTSTLVEIYWFALYGYGYSFCTGPHPTQGGTFADDSVPSEIDPIAGYGCFGFNEPGGAECPPPPVSEACCFDTGCQDLLPADCTAQGGVPQGPGSSCADDPCAPPPTGACCFGPNCEDLTAEDCARNGGDYQGDGTACSDVPDPCEIPTPTIDSSWGGVKSIYR